MSEFWVAHKKYFCKYCNIYIADDAPSRKQHETGLRHKGNVERFVRGLYKAGEKRKADLEEEKREMARIEKAAGAAYAQDVASGLTKPGSSSSPGPSSSAAAGPKVAAPKPSNPYANYSTAESLGYVDPDLERAKAEAEQRRTQGIAGEWEVVDVIPPPQKGDEQEQEGGRQAEGEHKPGEVSARAGEKRPAEGPVDEEDGRGWKLRRKTANVGLGDLYDPGALPIKLKPKKQEEQEQSGSPGAIISGAGPALGGSEKPRWSARGWNKPGASSITGTAESTDEQEAKTEEDGVKVVGESLTDTLAHEPLPEEPPVEVKTEDVKSEPIEPAAPPPSTGGSLFKKRKAPVGGGSRGGRRF
ncbi:hypothetical protein L226DRAFT_60976 [Lentinus tigrinus ALCF2SS1-7]|uniref:Matrin-type domain-containing protein n=1 Tax=Lentinus tigrinus ALCF2SS1-6 TaxID=1328759 RepID=A0A5C2RSU8_9APHY|nr:hypothetical protein L227DRAFT_595844 [Lentinus tigrinus ALCF2SS1-6]RPD75335.1 hypothetical protein L226DRAFT_60976 [Lentinus tigrinus ALCF2SS1-7]